VNETQWEWLDGVGRERKAVREMRREVMNETEWE
jgi:hypothetical protein